jgi:hypothetical protein
MNYSAQSAAKAANQVVPVVGSTHAAAMLRETIICGVTWDLPAIRPSSVEIASAVGCAHSTAQQRVAAWQRMHWDDRYGWLRLVDGWLSEYRSEARPIMEDPCTTPR